MSTQTTRGARATDTRTPRNNSIRDHDIAGQRHFHGAAPDLIAALTAYADRRRQSLFAHVLDVRPNPSEPGFWLVTVACPLCGQTHTHGTSPEDVQRMSVAAYREHVNARHHDLVIRAEIPLAGGDNLPGKYT